MSTDLLYRVFTLKRIFRFTFLHQSFNRCSQAFSLFNLQGAISLFRRVFRTFQALSFLGDSLFSISGSEPFVKNFFQLFSFSKSCSVPRRRSLRSSLFSISHTPSFVNTFFSEKRRNLRPPQSSGWFLYFTAISRGLSRIFSHKNPVRFLWKQTGFLYFLIGKTYCLSNSAKTITLSTLPSTLIFPSAMAT